MNSSLKPPAPEPRPQRSNHHGRKLVDEYAWLRAPNWQEVLRQASALPNEIRDYLQSEFDYFHAAMIDTEPLQAQLALEMRDRLPDTETVAWTPDGPFEYSSYFRLDAAHPQLVRRDADGSGFQIIVDLEAESKGKPYFRAGYSTHSPDHRLLAWSRDELGSECYTISFRNLQTGKDQADQIHNASSIGAFSRNGSYFLYIGIDGNYRKSRLYLHRIGDVSSKDVLLLEEQDPRFALSIRVTQSRDWFVASSHSHDSSDVYLFSATNPLASARLVISRQSQSKWYIDEGCGVLYALTNVGGADDYKIMIAPPGVGGALGWQELIPHRSGTTITGHRVFKRHLVWVERWKGTAKVMIRRLGDGKTRSVGFGEAACSLDLGVTHEFDTHVVRLLYSSMNTSLTTFDCDMDSGVLTPVKSQTVKGGFRADNYITERVLAISADGTQVPVSLMYHRRTPLDGTAPCVLYGYGAYGVSLSASFDSNRLSLVDRGLVYAVAHVRGGGEMGSAWHHAGRAKRKIDGIADFIAAARYLVARGYCGASNIVSHGVSAGGALVAAAANMAPEMFSGVIAEAPFVDVLNTMLDVTLPLTAQEWQEWGNPAASAVEFDQLASWSPYENVTAQPYPPVLAVIGLLDPRVTYWEPVKWVARLRARQTGDSPILLRINFNEGHIGSAGRIGKLADTALLYAFVLKVTGRALPASRS